MDTKEYMNSLPCKKVGAGALIFNEDGKILIVKPNYKDGWLIPGGTCDKNESPRAGCLREVSEEVGLILKDVTLICVDYVADTKGFGDAFQFIFYGGIIKDKSIIKLQTKELDEHKFVGIDEALALLRPGLKSRLPHCLEAIKNGKVVYLESIQ